MKLDIGSGSNPSGNVNIDIPNSEIHRGENNPLKTKAPNFILANAEKMPFRENIFTTIKAHHSLEHIYRPYDAIKEIKRVLKSPGNAHLMIPSEFNIGHGAIGHIYTWNISTFENLLRLVFDRVAVGYVGRKTIISPIRKICKFIPILLPLLGKIGLHPELYACVEV